jgi:hypothetical protein
MLSWQFGDLVDVLPTYDLLLPQHPGDLVQSCPVLAHQV